MITFYEGTLDTMIERLRDTISGFDKDWIKKCIPAAEKQVQRLENICKQYHYALLRTYLSYLRTMGKNDGCLLERVWDGFI